MEILKRARGNAGEVIPFGAPPAGLQDEINHRTYKAGYTDRDGQPKISRNDGAGKGDVPRPHNMKKYRENYVKIFGHN